MELCPTLCSCIYITIFGKQSKHRSYQLKLLWNGNNYNHIKSLYIQTIQFENFAIKLMSVVLFLYYMCDTH